jgi:Ca-activated chloride channel family protein
VSRIFDLSWVALLAVPSVLLAGAVFWLWYRRRSGRLARLGGDAAIARLAPAEVRKPPLARALRVSVAVGLMVLGLSGPRWGASTGIVKTDGIDVVLALDASLSMLTQDERPSRLERMKQEVRRFRAAAPGDRVALLAFAGRSYILTPLTNDEGAIELFLDNLDPSIVGQTGTAIEPTIRQGIGLLEATRGSAGRALVILSDGEAFDDAAPTLAAARDARAAGIHVVTVGFGTEAGNSIPIVEGGQTIAKRDADGNMVISRYDPALLRDIAANGGGEFIAATETDKGARIHQALSRLDAKQREVEEGRSRPLRLAWFLFPAFLLLMVDAWRTDGGAFSRLRRLRRLLRLGPKTTAVAAMLVATFAVSRAGAQSSKDAMTAFVAKDYWRAAQLWRQQIADGDKRPGTLYNYGTAMLAADSLAPAVEALERAAFSPDAVTRQQALYNLGLAQLKRGTRADNPDAERSISAAIAAYRTLLLQRPQDAEARWNYELALNVKRKGGGGGSNSKPNQQPQSGAQQNPDGNSMSKQQAEQLLSSAARDEKATQAKRQKGTRQDRPPGGKDW